MKRLALLGLVVGFSAVAGVASGAHRVVAAETHTDCITFDSSGNVIGITPSCSMTVSQRGGDSQSFPGVDPCTGDTGTLTASVTHQIYHINVDGGGEAWDTGTMSGTLSFTPDDASAPSGSGPYANWFGDSFNERNMEQTFTFAAHLSLSNGQSVTVHEVGHVTFAATDPITPVVAFDKPSMTCNG